MWRMIKKSFVYSYPCSLISSLVAILLYAKAYELKPGFELMLFSMRFFTASSCLFFIVFYLVFTAARLLKTDPPKPPQS